MADKLAGKQDEDDKGVGNFGIPGIHVLPHSDNNQRTSNRINRQAHLPDETIKGGNDLDMKEILRRVEFTQISKGKFKGQWRARFLSRGAATTGKTQINVAMNIIMNGKKINKKLVRLM